MLQTALTKPKNKLAAYPELVRRVRQAIAQGKTRAEDAVERELLRTKWEVGKLILEHILLNHKRGKYGEEVFQRLSKDLGTSETELKYMVEYARSNPNRPHAGDLSWDRQRDLLAINDIEKRKSLAQRAVKEKWSRNDLRREIKKLKLTAAPVKEKPLEAVLGKTGTYRISKNDAGKRYVDLGFSNYLKLDKKSKFKEGDIVQLSAISGQLSAFADSGKLKAESLLYTYRAHVLEILDGDTLRVEVELGFSFTSVQKLRLRGLDAPEIVTREGQEAKKFVEKLLAPRPTNHVPRKTKTGSRGSWPMGHGSIIITSTKSDKYDRYLADVFIPKGHSRASGNLQSGFIYLNQKLLNKGLAVTVQD